VTIVYLTIVVPAGSRSSAYATEPAGQKGPEGKPIKVSWDFGSGPGKTSNFYVGEKTVPTRYDTPDCSSRFTLESARYELAKTPDGKPGAPFVMFTLRKHFSGDFELLPALTITQVTSARNKPTTTADVRFPFREKQMAAPVKDWTLPDIDVRLGAPGAIMDLHNPFGWSVIEVSCK